jgi:hypothetical protein
MGHAPVLHFSPSKVPTSAQSSAQRHTEKKGPAIPTVWLGLIFSDKGALSKPLFLFHQTDSNIVHSGEPIRLASLAQGEPRFSAYLFRRFFGK